MIRIRTRARQALAAALLALPLAAPAAQAQDTRPVVAVLNFENNSIGKDARDYDGIGRGMASLLINDLAAADSRVRVVERERIEAVLREQNLSSDGRIDPETAVRVGKILGASHVITGQFMNMGGSVAVLNGRAIDTETSQITNPQQVRGSNADVLALVSRLNADIVSGLRLPARPRQTGDAGRASGAPGATQAGGATQVAVTKDPAPAPAAAPAASRGKLDVRTALLYSKALAAQDAGNRTQAIELYNQVLDRFPNLETARQNRDRLQASGD